MKWLLPLLLLTSWTAKAQDTTIISKDLMVVQLSEHIYVHISWFENEAWSRFASNGMIYVFDHKAYLFDTPISLQATDALLNYIQYTMHCDLVGFVPNHFHEDCTGGIGLIQQREIPVYAQLFTDILLQGKANPADQTFTNSLVLPAGSETIQLHFFGPGHAPDNIVVWIPSEKVLFGGCMVKSLKSTTLGNTTDADLTEWPKTIQKVLDHYPNAETVIPGHGAWGNTDLLEYTIELLERNK